MMQLLLYVNFSSATFLFWVIFNSPSSTHHPPSPLLSHRLSPPSITSLFISIPAPASLCWHRFFCFIYEASTYLYARPCTRPLTVVDQGPLKPPVLLFLLAFILQWNRAARGSYPQQPSPLTRCVFNFPPYRFKTVHRNFILWQRNTHSYSGKRITLWCCLMISHAAFFVCMQKKCKTVSLQRHSTVTPSLFLH